MEDSATANASDVTLYFKCFGRFEISCSEGSVTHVSGKAAALLARLALDSNKSLSRSAARLLLWEEQAEEQAQGSLRSVIWKLRRAFEAVGFDGFRADANGLSLDPARIDVDRDQQLIRLASRRAADLSRDPAILPDFALLDGFDAISEGYGTWLAQERLRYRRDLIAVLERRLAQARGADVLTWADAIVSVDPLHEGAVQALIEGHAAAGRSANALVVYSSFWKELDEAFGEEPSSRTRDLIVAVKEDRVAPSRPPASADYRVGLLPVRFDTDNRRLAGFAVLLANALCTAMPETGVISVHDLRDGSIAPEGGTIDLTLVLCLAAAGDDVLVQSLAHRASDRKVILSRARTARRALLAPDLAQDIAAELVALLCARLADPDCLGEPERHRAAAHILYGIDQMFRLEGGSIPRAETAFAAATALDPKGPFFAWQAYLAAFQFEQSRGFLDPAFRERTRELAARAMEADAWNNLSRALLCHVHSFVFGDFAAAEAMIAPALAMPRTNVMVDDSYSLLCFYTGRYGPAAQAAERANHLGRFSPYRYLFSTTLCMIAAVDGAPLRALAHGIDAINAHPRQNRVVFRPLLRYLAVAASQAGDRDRALSLFAQIRRQDPEFSVAGLAEHRSLTPNPDAARLLIDTLRPLEACVEDHRDAFWF